jgi:predicted phage tail protein
MLVRIYLHGHLRDKVKKDFVETEATTVMDALQFLAYTYKRELKVPLDLGRWKVKVKDYETKESWYVPLMENEIHVYPIFKTAKSQWVSIGIGSLLMVGAVLAGPAGWAGIGTVGAGWVSSGVATFMATTGFSIMLSGVMSLLFPTPKLDTAKPTDSKYLGAQGNTVAVGTRIPFGYGLFKIAGHYISYNVSSTTVREIA